MCIRDRLLRVFVVGGVLWVGWLWGHAETGSLRAEAERTLYENNQQISDLSTDLQRLEMELAEARAKNKVEELARDNDADLKALVTKKIARGVAPSHHAGDPETGAANQLPFSRDTQCCCGHPALRRA